MALEASLCVPKTDPLSAERSYHEFGLASRVLSQSSLSVWRMTQECAMLLGIMALKDELSRRVGKKRQEIAALEQQIMTARAYLQAMDEALRLAERTNSPTATRRRASGLRNGSMPANAYPVLKQAGHPMYLIALLDAMKVPQTAKNKRTLASSLSAYARKKDVFTRPRPNTFGLIEFEENAGGGSSLDKPIKEPSGGPSKVRLVR